MPLDESDEGKETVSFGANALIFVYAQRPTTFQGRERGIKKPGLIIIVCSSIIDSGRCSQACRNNLVQHLDHLLFYGADMNARNASGNTPLHVCAVNNTDASCIRQLLFRGAQKDSLNYANQTPYQVAVIAGNMELAEVIKNYQPEEVGEC